LRQFSGSRSGASKRIALDDDAKWQVRDLTLHVDVNRTNRGEYDKLGLWFRGGPAEARIDSDDDRVADVSALADDWSPWAIRTQDPIYDDVGGTPPAAGANEVTATAVVYEFTEADGAVGGWADHVLAHTDTYMIARPYNPESFVDPEEGFLDAAIKLNMPYIQFRAFQIWEEYNAPH
ncbi:MAG: hypothetical protein ACOCV2_02250, partial [Persicimonas sp.]